jgi:hypothetical protein
MIPTFMEDPERSKPGHEVKVSLPPRAEYRGKKFKAVIVVKNDDLIYQFFNVRHKDFQTLLAEIIEAHFGKTDDFSASYVPEFESLAVRAKKVCESPFFNYSHYTEKFLDLVDRCLDQS